MDYVVWWCACFYIYLETVILYVHAYTLAHSILKLAINFYKFTPEQTYQPFPYRFQCTC